MEEKGQILINKPRNPSKNKKRRKESNESREKGVGVQRKKYKGDACMEVDVLAMEMAKAVEQPFHAQ